MSVIVVFGGVTRGLGCVVVYGFLPESQVQLKSLSPSVQVPLLLQA